MTKERRSEREVYYDGDRVVEPLQPGHNKPPRAGHRPPPAPQHRSLFWPILLIGAGILLLLSNLGMLPAPAWHRLWQLWPLALVALGVDVLFGQRSALGAFIGTVLILIIVGLVVLLVFFSQYAPEFLTLPTPTIHSDFVTHSLRGVEEAEVTIDWTLFPGTLSALADSDNLIEADVDYLGELTFDARTEDGEAVVKLDTRSDNMNLTTWEERKWTVKLSPDVLLDLTLDASMAQYDFDLRDLQLSHLYLDASTGAIELWLPDSSDFTAKIEASTGKLTITVPKNVGARIELESSTGAFNPDNRFYLVEGNADGDSTWETEDYGDADYNIVLLIDQSTGVITVR